MLPASLQIPAALLLLIGGVISCFAGYRLFRVVLGIFGFIIGALFASGAVGTEHAMWMIGAALVGGIVGALILIAAYFVGVALIGAGVGVGLAGMIWASIGSEPGTITVILFAVAGALGALMVQRYVIIGGTAFVGAWTIVLGAIALSGRAVVAEAARNNVWLLYPMNPVPGHYWAALVGIALGIAGVLTQLMVTAKQKQK